MKNFIATLLNRDNRKHQERLLETQVLTARSEAKASADRLSDTINNLLSENDRIRLKFNGNAR